MVAELVMYSGSFPKLQPMASSVANGAAAAVGSGGRVNFFPQVSRISSLHLLPSFRGLVSRQCRASRRNGGSASRPDRSSDDDDDQVLRISSLDFLPSPRGSAPRQWRGSNGDEGSASFRSEGSSSEDEFAAGLFRENGSGSSFAITQLWQQLHPVLCNKQGAMGALAAMMMVGLQTCPEAWAGAEVAAKINVNPGLFDLGDWSDVQSGFAGAFLLIFFSEIGDKTFFIAALLATRKSSVAVFSGTFGALMAMTVISVCLGRVFHYIDGILPSFGDTKLPVDDIAAVILLVYFGLSTLIDAASMEDSDSGEEQQEAELAIANVGAGGAVAGTVAATFALVFVAEWGDKSFFSTIALAAASSPLGVVSGAIAGHGAATLLAVLGGSFLGNYVSEKVIAYVGGVLFLIFAGATLLEILN
ncbi:unnamed protein product [Calypogeia fissa]